MADHRDSESKELAALDTIVSDSGFSKLSRYEKTPRDRRRSELERQNKRQANVSEPSVLITVNQDNNAQHFEPGSILSAEYNVKLAPDTSLAAIESSVIWVTEGKGEEDIGVHFFERRNQASFTIDTFDRPQRLSTVLPLSPLSYEGQILTISWQVRIRLFMVGGRDFINDHPFRLSVTGEPCRWVNSK